MPCRTALAALFVLTVPAVAQSPRNPVLRASADLSVIHLSNDRLFFGPGISLGGGYPLSDRWSAVAGIGFTNMLSEHSQVALNFFGGNFHARYLDGGARFVFKRVRRYEFFSDAVFGWREMQWSEGRNVCTPAPCHHEVTRTQQRGVGGTLTVGVAARRDPHWAVHWAGRRGFNRYFDVSSSDPRMSVPTNAHVTTLELGVRFTP